jgi:hypothetical protein
MSVTVDADVIYLGRRAKTVKWVLDPTSPHGHDQRMVFQAAHHPSCTTWRSTRAVRKCAASRSRTTPKTAGARRSHGRVAGLSSIRAGDYG